MKLSFPSSLLFWLARLRATHQLMLCPPSSVSAVVIDDEVYCIHLKPLLRSWLELRRSPVITISATHQLMPPFPRVCRRDRWRDHTLHTTPSFRRWLDLRPFLIALAFACIVDLNSLPVDRSDVRDKAQHIFCRASVLKLFLEHNNN